MNTVLLGKHIKEVRGDLLSLNIDEGNLHFKFDLVLMDEDAAPFLRDLRAPFFVKYIRYSDSDSDTLFYKNSKIQKPPVHPPRDTLLKKQVYWGASHCERNMLC
jgi:hypothetical protein